MIDFPLLPSVRGDTAQLAHLFPNLPSNALKYQKNRANVTQALPVESPAVRTEHASSSAVHSTTVVGGATERSRE